MKFVERVKQFNNFEPDGFMPFVHNDECIGFMRFDFVEKLKVYPDIFSISGQSVQLHNALKGYKQITATLLELGNSLVESGDVKYLLDEPYPVKNTAFETLFELDRALVAYFGFRSYGQHLNGFVRRDEQLFLWIARRSLDRRIFPGKLDNLVAGGLPHGLSLKENLQKECLEEAGMQPDIASRAILVSALTYNAMNEKGYKPDTLYCYDIELSEEFVPENTDGEVAGFELMPVEEVKDKIMEGGLFKPNCELVIMDFFCRHGLMDGETGEFLQLQQALRAPFKFDEVNIESNNETAN